MRKVALSIMLIGSLTASSAALAAHNGGAFHGLASPSLSMSRTNLLPSTVGGLGTNRLLNNNLGNIGSGCNMPSYSADRNINCQ